MIFPIIVLASAALTAQTNSAPLTFEVASVRPHRGASMRTGPLTISGPLIRLEGYTLFGLVMDAWNLRDFQLSFVSLPRPEDFVDVMYDVVARVPGNSVPRSSDVRARLQNLLAERFHLRVHRELREMRVYALVTGKNGARLKPSRQPSGQCSVKVGLAIDGRNNEEVFSACPVDRLAARLTNLMGDRPVLDETGLTGTYDFRLLATPEFRTRDRSDSADIPPIAAIGDLGLRLVSKKAPVEILVVDHLERLTEN